MKLLVFTLLLLTFGLFADANELELLHQKLEETKADKNYETHILTLVKMSDYFTAEKEYGKAEEYAQKALKAASLLSSDALKSACFNSLGHINVAQGFYSDAIGYYNSAQSLSDSSSSIYILLNICNCASKKGDFLLLKESVIKLKELLIETSPNDAFLYIRTAEYANGYDDWGTAKQLHDFAVNKAMKTKNYQVLSRCDSLKSEHLFTAGKYKEAEQLLRRSIFFASKAEYTLELYSLYRQLGKIQVAQEKNDAAVASYRISVELADKVRPYLNANESFETDSFIEISEIYYELAELLISQHKGKSINESQNSLKELCLLMESLKISELKNYFQDDCIIEMRNRDQALEEVADQKTALIYTVAMNHQLAVIVYHDKTYQLFSTDINFSQLRNKVVMSQVL